jgi:hypothetical protein
MQALHAPLLELELLARSVTTSAAMTPADLMQQVLSPLGVSLVANEVTHFFHRTSKPSRAELESFLHLHGVNAYAPNVIKAFAEHGYLSIDSSSLYGEQGASVAAGSQGKFNIKNSRVETGTGSFVQVPRDGSISGGHDAGVRQDDSGNVVFDVGKGGIKVNVGGENVVINTGRKR